MTDYMVLVGCENDKTGKRFEVGDVVTSKDFSAKVIKHWLEKAVLAVMVDDSDEERGTDGNR